MPGGTASWTRVQYLVLDARYEKVRVDGSVRDCAVLVAIGILPDGHRSVPGVSCSLSEAEVHWRSFLESLLTRGMKGVQCIVSDQHSGPQAARKLYCLRFLGNGCQFHLMHRALHYIPKPPMRKETAEDLRAVFLSKDHHVAQEELRRLVAKYQTTAPSFADRAEKNVPEGQTIFQLPAEHRKRMRTTNQLERLNKEMKRRTQVATLFPNRHRIHSRQGVRKEMLDHPPRETNPTLTEKSFLTAQGAGFNADSCLRGFA
jgi:transposase-like protein